MTLENKYNPLVQTVDEKLFRLLVASVHDYAIFMIDPNGFIMSWNQGAENIKGYTNDEIIGQHISIFYTATDVQNNVPRNNLNEALKKGVHEAEGWRVRKDTTRFWANVVFTTIYDEKGHFVGFAKITRDITKRKLSDDEKAKTSAELERRVRENTTRIISSELRFRKLIENSYDGITLLDKDLQVSYRSTSSERIIGWSNMERADYTLTELLHPDDRERVTALFAEILDKPFVPILTEYRTKHKMGHYIWLECLFTNMLEDENIKAIVCNFRDITEKKKDDEEIRKKTEQIENIFERITDGFIALDNNFCYTYANKKIGEMVGLDPDDLIGSYVWEKFPDAVNSETYKAFNKAIAEQRYVCVEDYYAPLDLWQENHIYPSPTGLSVFIRDISERKRAEINLNQNAQRFREMLENSGDILVVSNFEGNISYISPNITKILGYKHSEFEQVRRAINFVHPDEQEEYVAMFNLVRQNTGVVYPFVHRVQHANGHWLWVEGTVTNLLNNVAVNGVVTNFRDITHRKNSEEQIEKNHIQLQQASQTQAAILNALPSNIVLLNEKGKIIAVNQTWKSFTLSNNLGLPNYGIGYNYLVIAEKATGVDKATANQIAKGIKDVINGTKKQFIMEYPSHTQTQTRWFQVTVAPLTDEASKGAVVSHVNVTDRKLAESSLVQSEANLRSVFENTDLSIVLFDNDLNIVAFNTNAKNLSVRNFRKKLKTGNSGFNYFDKNQAEIIKKAISRVMNKEMVTYETTFMPDGVTLEWYEARWVCITNNKGENIGIIFTLKDITQKKLLEAERNKMTADLVKRNIDLEQYAYVVSHNLRAPVANILGLSNLLTVFEPGGPESNETIEALSASINNLDKVIIDLNQVLEVNNRASSKAETVSLPALVDSIKTGISPMIGQYHATIDYDFSEISELLTHRSYLRVIFQNLIVNSILYRRRGVDPVLTITSKIVGNMASIYFKDNGKGIDLEKNGAHVFGLYKRFDTSVEGKGMGLFMVKIQVESLGGTITLQSKLNEGTLFKITLPLTQTAKG